MSDNTASDSSLDMLNSLSTKDWNTLYQRHHKRIEQVNDVMMDAHFKAIQQVYIDLVLLKDTRMGLMLGLVDKVRFHYLEAGLQRYNRRLRRDFTSCYPEFPYKEDKLQQIYRDPRFSQDIFNHSPDTDLSYNLEDVLKLVVGHNHRAGYSQPIRVTINTWPLSITTLCKQYITILSQRLPKNIFAFSLISVDTSRWDKTQWLSYQQLYLDDIAKVLHYPGFAHALGDDGTWTNANIVSPPVMDDEAAIRLRSMHLDLDDPEVLKDILGCTEAVMQTFCNFNFMQVNIPLANPNSNKIITGGSK